MDDKKENTRETVIELLNNAVFLPLEKERIETLSKVQELVIHRDAALLDSFFEEIVAFQSDRNADVRKFVVGFIEEACKKDHTMLPRLVPNIKLLLVDEAIAVTKRVVQAAAQLHKSTLIWLSSSRLTTNEMEQTWEIICEIKTAIIQMIDHDNDGVRTQAIKFLESLVLAQTYNEPDSIERKGDFSLDQVPLTLKVARPRKLEEEAKLVLGKVIAFQGSLHISSVNLMTCMSSLTIIARSRPQFVGRVVQALEILHANLPPTLTKSQVNSVRKHLKIQLLNLLRHTAGYEYRESIVPILNDLGVGASEINKSIPNKEVLRKRIKRTKSLIEESSAEMPKKKICLEKIVSDPVSLEEEPSQVAPTAVDITQRWLVDRLKIDSVANMVMVTMLNLPDVLPPLFSVAYTPVNAAGSPAQIQHVARLLASQLTAAGIGPGAEKQEQEELKAQKDKEKEESDSENEEECRKKIPMLVGKVSQGNKVLDKAKICEQPLMPSGIISRPAAFWQKAKFVKLGEITKPLSTPTSFKLQLLLLKRILSLDKNRLYGSAHKCRLRILAKFTTIGTDVELLELEAYIFKDLSSNFDLLLSWLYSQHSSSQDFNPMSKVLDKHFRKGLNEYSSYHTFILHTVRRIMEMTPNKERDDLVSRLVLECPNVPQNVIDYLVSCINQGREVTAMIANLLKDLILWRPLTTVTALNALCSLAMHNDLLIRDVAEPTIVELHGMDRFRQIIADVACKELGYLTEPKPAESVFSSNLGRSVKLEEWSEESVRACLFLVLMLLPHHQELIHFLAQIYVKTVNEAKRTILRYLETPISHMGMDSPTLLELVETCPKGSETLITRIIHILTEKAPPSEELVCHVRELYNKRVSDVRFLIPVLTGLSKKEVIAVLPKLIKLNPNVVKEVFNRLWGVTLDKGTSPLSPIELLVTLHLISNEKCDVKTIIKATALCFTERNIYTAEVLAVVLQHLMDQPTLPTLFMRTVIQTLTHHPKLTSFIMNILQRLITKQVWKQKKAWEGFIKCCQRSVPQSFVVLLQLPPTQLSEVLTEAQDLHNSLSEHINNLTDTQRAHIPSSILDVIRNPVDPALGLATVKIEPIDQLEHM